MMASTTTASSPATSGRRKSPIRRKLAFLALLPLLSSLLYLFSTTSNLKYYLSASMAANNYSAFQNNNFSASYAGSNGRNHESSSLYYEEQSAAADQTHQQNHHQKSNLNNYYNNSSSANYNDYTVTFIPSPSMPSNHGDIYSGMWYQSISLMMSTSYTSVTNLESVTFTSFHASLRNGVLSEMSLQESLQEESAGNWHENLTLQERHDENMTTENNPTNMTLQKRHRNNIMTLTEIMKSNELKDLRDKYHPLMTQDWLDFSVEHLSKYVKHFDKRGGGVMSLDDVDRVKVKECVMKVLRGYVDMSLEVKRLELEMMVDSNINNNMENEGEEENEKKAAAATEVAVATAALQHTIAIIPIKMGGIQQPDDISSILQTTATIVSLWRYHFPRIVIAGVSENEREAYQEMMKMLQDHLQLIPNTEVVYVYMEGVEKEWKNVPKMAMLEFQRAVRESRRNDTVTTISTERSNSDDEDSTNNNSNSSNVVKSWLGTNPTRWKHIYFTEPDLLLHTRLMALPSLVRQLNQGRIMTAHRLQPLPHIQQFLDIVDGGNVTQQQARSSKNNTMNNKKSNLLTYFNHNALPNHGPFATNTIQLLNPNNTSCCDQGNFFPANTNNTNEPLRPRKHHGCPSTYELCGFRNKKLGHDYSNWTYMERAHHFLVNYTLIALEEGYGTGVPLVHAHQRVCRMQKEVCS